MTDIETKIEVEAGEFTDELTDEALDREGAVTASRTGGMGIGD